jgi:two-component system, OmpR family, copper resistance phosphate regulon response regulator CusR
MRILLIEDEPRIRAFIASGLGAEGFTVVERDDGQVGLRHALAEQYDLVILDLGLPSLDGLSVLRALSRQRPQLPVLILSARLDLRTKLTAFSAGACDYLEKPFAFDELLTRVREKSRRRAETVFDLSTQ